MITARAFAGKHYAVYGLAQSGMATAQALLASGAKVSAWDDKEEARAKAPEGTNVANLDQADLGEFDSVVVTPGLPLNRHPIAQRARDAGVEIIGDIELFARARADLPPHKVVGITGTNGKSTTTALVHHILKTAGVPTTMGGNIGLPILAQEPLTPNDKWVGVYVLELSRYQIDLTRSLDCDIAVLLNITPDHLDRYEDFEAYAASKERLFEMQSANHFAVIVGEDEHSRDISSRHSRERAHPAVFVAAERDPRSRAGDELGETLKGPHNSQNAQAAIRVCQALGVEQVAIGEGLRTFPGLPHRMERVRQRDGVLFVNDSKATNPTATAPALAAFESIRWICGGQAKTDSLDQCAPHFSHVRSAYTIGEAAGLFERLLKPHMPVKNCGKLEAAVNEAAADAEAGDTLLLSPACASFDQFRDFEERGDKFKELAGAL